MARARRCCASPKTRTSWRRSPGAPTTGRRWSIGFAAETDDIVANAQAKRVRKCCDWILANDVSPGTGTFGGDRNTIHLVDGEGVEDWPAMTKTEVAARLAERVAQHLRPQ